MKNRNFPISFLFAIIAFSCSSPSTKAPVDPPPVPPRNDLPNMIITALDESKINVHALKENTILILFQFIGMNKIITVRALEPTTKAVFLSGLNFNFWFITRK